MGFGDKIKALSPDIFIEIHQKLLICGDIIQPEAHHHIQLPLFDSFHQEMEVGAVQGFGTVLTKIRVMLELDIIAIDLSGYGITFIVSFHHTLDKMTVAQFTGTSVVLVMVDTNHLVRCVGLSFVPGSSAGFLEGYLTCSAFGAGFKFCKFLFFASLIKFISAYSATV
jgi:hypothetical protein